MGPPVQGERLSVAGRRAEESYRGDLLAQLPLSSRAQNTVVLPTDLAATGENPMDLRMLDPLYLMVGASFYPDMSFMVSATLAPSAAIHHGAVGFHNLMFGEGQFNLRVGRLLLLDFVRPEHRAA